MRTALPFALLALVGCHRPEEASASQPAREASPPIHVQTASVIERPMPQYLALTGSLRADQESNIAADANGKVLQLLVERGQPVMRGQVIATLDARSASLGATAAQAQAHLAQSQLEQAQRECERVKHLLQTGAISQADYDRQTSQCTVQQWSAAAAEAQQQSATKLLGDTSIRAPFDGVIGERMVNVGQYVQPSTQVASIYDPDPLRLAVTVPEASLADVKAGMPVTFTVAAFGEERFLATVKFISPNVRESSRDLIVEAVAPNHEGRLRPGMFAVARLELSERSRPVVPTSSVKYVDTEARVFVVEPTKEVQERLVQVGASKGDVVAILGGVRAGEAVVLLPGPDVRDGARVE
ncbi:MAG: efflux RND transporter periplasmic adaptor subunit [Polyangiaceae bacterium]|jgi:membrane fusion protein, multidrug efflux system